MSQRILAILNAMTTVFATYNGIVDFGVIPPVAWFMLAAWCFVACILCMVAVIWTHEK